MLQRIFALLLALALVLSGLAGCGKQENQETTAPTAAMGRYVETELALPAAGYPRDLVTLTDGRLRLSLMTEEGAVRVFTQLADGSWQEDILPQQLEALGQVDVLRLSPDGTVFVSQCEELEGGNYAYHLSLVSPEGAARELPLTGIDADDQAGFLIGNADFTASGKLMVLFSFDDLRELTEGDSFGPNLNSLGIWTNIMGCAGEDTYLLNDELCGRVRQGQQDSLTDVLGRQLMASAQATSGNSGKCTYWQNAKGYLFFTTDAGLYSYVPDGSVTEELVSADKSSFGDPSFTPVAMTGTEEGVFYVLAWQSGGAVLCRYAFDANVPLQATKTLKIYTLYDDDDLNRMVAKYRKDHPELEVYVEVGLTGEDGMTEADALRTLNTEILAGSGPDVLRMDGMSLDSYRNKDVLLDLSGLLEETQTLEQITRCYASDGKISVLPTAFAIPAVYGPRSLVSQITGLDSLVSAAAQALAENSEATNAMYGMFPELLTDNLYDSCSAAWKQADGTLDAAALERWLDAMNQLYALDAPLREKYADMLQAMEGETILTPGDYTAVSGARGILMNGTAISVGTLESMDLWSFALAGDDQLEDYALEPLYPQTAGVFLPRQLYGILSASDSVAEAMDFLRFVLSEEVQEGWSYGFPVNQSTFDREIAQDKVSKDMFASSDENGNMISFMSRYPSAAERQQFQTWVEGLTTPALTDRTIRNVVMEQATACLKGTVTPAQAASQALQTLNLYLSE